MSPSEMKFSPSLAAPTSTQRVSGQIAAAILAIGVLLCLIVIIRHSFDGLAQANRWNVHSYQVLEQIRAVRASIGKEENHLRGFALTAKTDSLNLALQDEKEGLGALEKLQELTNDKPEQQGKIKEISAEYTQWRRHLTRTFRNIESQTRRGVTLTTIAQQVSAQTNARRIEQTRLASLLNEMDAFERNLLKQRSADLNDAQRQTAAYLWLGSIFAITLTGFLAISLRRHSNSEMKSAQELREVIVQLRHEADERSVTEALLRDSEEGYRHLAEDSSDLICRHQADGTFSYVSPVAKVLLGFSPSELLGMEPSVLFHADDYPPGTAFSDWIADTDKRPRPVRVRRSDGKLVWLEIKGHAISLNESGSVTQFHTTSRDITARVSDDTRRQFMLEGLRRIVETTDQLLAGTSESDILQRAVALAGSALGCHEVKFWRYDPITDSMNGTFALLGTGQVVEYSKSQPYASEFLNEYAPVWHGARWQHAAIDPLDGTTSVGITPLFSRDGLIGTFHCRFEQEDVEISNIRQELVSVFCSMVAALLERTRSEQQFRQSQRLLSTVVENSPLILYSVNKEERYTLITGRGLQKLGWGNELVGQRVEEVTGTSSVSINGIRECLQGKSTNEAVSVGDFIFDSHRHPIWDEEGNVVGMVGVAIDITERHNAEEALRESESRYRSVIDNLSEVIFQMDMEGHWTLLNPAWTESLGYSVSESLGRLFLDYVHPEDQGHCVLSFAQIMDNVSDSCYATARFVNVEGEIRWMEVFARAIVDASGKPTGVTGTLNDVTERKLAEAALEETTELQRAILEGAAYAIYACDSRGIIQSFNPAAEELLGYLREELVGRVQPLVFHDPVEIQNLVREVEKETGQGISAWRALVFKAEQEGSHEREVTFIRSDSTRRPVRLTISVLRDSDGSTKGYVAIAYDLTEFKRAQRLKSEFVSVVSHELRTPLTSIRGALGLLAGGVAGPLPERASQMIEIAHKNAGRLVLLINDILDIEKIESGAMRFEMGAVDVQSLLEGALEANRAYGSALGVSMGLESWPEELAGARVEGDEARLVQVLANLLSNAAKFTPSGGHVSLRAKPIEPPVDNSGEGESSGNGNGNEEDSELVSGMRKWIRIEVSDEGEGVPPEFESRLFERFAQADSSATRQQGGTGLGLAIARAIVEKQGGRIGYLPPQPGHTNQGATFFFDLPLLEQVKAVPESIEVQGKILVCEDDAEAARWIATILENAGYTTVTASTLEEARRLVESEHVQGITLDLLLPDGDGLTLLEELRKKGRTLPVIVVSLYAEEGKMRGGAADVIDWLPKPFEAQRLVQCVRNFKPRTGTGEKPRIIHIEDDLDIQQVTRLILEGLALVENASTLEEARTKLMQQHFDLALLDLGLPDGDGWDLVPLLSHEKPPVPVVIFSARETDSNESREVAAALVKSRTNNGTLRTTIEELLRLRTALFLPPEH